MRIAVGADETGVLPDAVVADLARRGHDAVLVGPLAQDPIEWADIGIRVGELVASGAADCGVCLCWTGTGVSIAANKVRGVRAALCVDAETARGARRWNDANVLALSMRSTTPHLAEEMLDAWFDSAPDASEASNIAKVNQ